MKEIQMKSDAIIVLGDMLKPDGSISDNLRMRLDKGIELFRKNVAPRIIASGYYGFMASYKPPITEASAMKEYMLKNGISDNDILLEEKSKDTIGNAYFTKIQYLKPNWWKNIVVVTSDFHLQRAKYVFEKVLGEDYHIHFIGTKNTLSAKDLELMILREKKVTEFIKQYTDKIDPEDDKTTENMLYSEHPAYAKNPKITKEDILKMLK